MLFVVAGGWFVLFGVRLAFPVLLPHIRDGFGLSLTVAGALLSVLGLAYAIGQFPGGILGDHYGERRIMIFGALAAALSSVILLFSIEVWMLFAGTFLVGISAAIFSPARYVIISKIYDKSDGTAMSVVSASGNLGAAVIPAGAGVIAASLSWRLGFGVAVPAFLFVAFSIWLLVPRPRTESPKKPEKSTDSGVSPRSFIKKLSTRPILMLTVLMVCHSTVFQGFTAFYPTYLVDIKGISASLSATLFGAFFAVGVGTKLISGVVSDVFRKERTLFTLLSILTASLVLLPFVSTVISVVVLTVFLTALLGIVPVATALLTEELPEDIAGSGLGFLRTLYLATGTVSPIMVGYIADAGFFNESFLLLAAVAFVGSLASLLIGATPDV